MWKHQNLAISKGFYYFGPSRIWTFETKYFKQTDVFDMSMIFVTE